MEKEYLTFGELKQFLGIKSNNTMDKLIKAGLPFIKVAKTRRFNINAVRKFLDDNTIQVNKND